jgi:hypothetical protein
MRQVTIKANDTAIDVLENTVRRSVPGTVENATSEKKRSMCPQAIEITDRKPEK